MTILLVEDHETVRGALREWLEVVFPHSRVVEAASGEEAVSLVQNEPPNLVIMDITLPGMNGIEATRKIKSILPSTQIVMLTIHDDNIYRTYAVDAGANAYVPKRAMRTDLIPTLTALLADFHD